MKQKLSRSRILSPKHNGNTMVLLVIIILFAVGAVIFLNSTRKDPQGPVEQCPWVETNRIVDRCFRHQSSSIAANQYRRGKNHLAKHRLRRGSKSRQVGDRNCSRRTGARNMAGEIQGRRLRKGVSSNLQWQY